MITLHRPTLWAVWRILPWRKAAAEGLRTAPGTPWSQFKFWLRLQRPDCPHRYWTVKQDGRIVGFTGLVHGSEISLIVDPKRRGQGIGERAVMLALEQATKPVWGEVYASNQARAFWYRLTQSRGGQWLPIQTERQGQTVDAYLFTLPKRAA